MSDPVRSVLARRVVSLALVSTLGVATMATGCASEEPNEPPMPSYTLQPDAVLAPRGVSDAAIVEADKITVKATEETRKWAASLKPGEVIAGNRDTRAKDPSKSQNPGGFLGRVVSVEMGTPIVIHTKRAELQELFAEADLDFGVGRSIFPDAPLPDTSVTATRTLRPLEEGTEGELKKDCSDSDRQAGKCNSSKPQNDPAASMNGDMAAKDEGGTPAESGCEIKLNVRDGEFTLSPEIRGKAKLTKQVTVNPCRSRFNPLGFAVSSCEVSQDVPWPDEVWLEMEAKPHAKFSLDVALGCQVTKSFEYDFGGASLSFTFPAGPVPITLTFSPQFSCEFGAGAAATLTVTPELNGTIKAKTDFWSGVTHSEDFTGTIKSEGSGQANVSGKCSLKGTISALAFNSIGLEGSIGPFIEGGAAVCAGASGFGGSAKVSAGVEGDVKGVVQVFTDLLRLAEIPIYENSFTAGELSVGDAEGCPVCKWPAIPTPPAEEGATGLVECKDP